MTLASNRAGPIALALMFGLGQGGCNTRTSGADDAAAVDRGVQSGRVDTAAAPPAEQDSTVTPPAADPATARVPNTPVDTPPSTPPSPPSRDTATTSQPGKPTDQGAKGSGLKVSRLEYEGWRQYSVNCARCHGQDVLPNPVAANLLVSLGPNGAINSPEKFVQVVGKGRVERGMPAFETLLTPAQINAMYAYVKGRAEGRIPPGRPDRPGA